MVKLKLIGFVAPLNTCVALAESARDMEIVVINNGEISVRNVIFLFHVDCSQFDGKKALPLSKRIYVVISWNRSSHHVGFVDIKIVVGTQFFCWLRIGVENTSKKYQAD